MDQTWSVVTADFDADGQPELAAVRRFDSCIDDLHENRVFVHRQDPQVPGRFLQPSAHPVALQSEGLFVADINADMRPDLLATGWDGVSILRQSGTATGTFQPALQIPIPTWAISAADVDADGDQDLAISPRSAAVAIERRPELLLQNPSALNGFDVTTSPGPLQGNVPSLALSDLDLDGRTDLVAAVGGNFDHLGVLLRDPSMPLAFQPAQAYELALGDVAGVAVAHLDQDDYPDVVVVGTADASTGGQGIQVFLGDPSAPGSLLASRSYQGCPIGRGLVLRDVNADGAPDIVAAGYRLAPARNCVVVLLQGTQRDGTFNDPVMHDSRHSSGHRFGSLAVDDLNGDNLVDIAFVDLGISILFQQAGSPGAFQPAQRLYDD
jgi:hypothetical protein